MDTFQGILLIVVLFILIRIISSPIQAYIDKRAEERTEEKINNRIGKMSKEEKLSILNSNEFKEWLMLQWDMDMPASKMDDEFKLLEDYMLTHPKKFL